MSTSATNIDSLDAFLRAKPLQLRTEIFERRAWLAAWCVVLIVVGAGAYGAAMGSWRDGWQALFSGIKLPLAVLLTTLGNGLLNGMLAPLLGLNVTFRQSLVLVLLTFAFAACVLGALSPVALFLIWNTPPLTALTQVTSLEYQSMQLVLAVFVAFAGILGNLHVVPLLGEWTRNVGVARTVLFAWLAGNLLLGSQICWVLRPFIWDPAGGPTRFMGREYLNGSFYETVFEAARRLIVG